MILSSFTANKQKQIDKYLDNNVILEHTASSLMFVRINICIFATKPCLWGLICAVSMVSSGLVNYLGA